MTIPYTKLNGHYARDKYDDMRPYHNDFLNIKIPVLDEGHVILRNYMGGDKEICQSARVSDELKGYSRDSQLIEYLLEHKHWSPFEHVVFSFDVKLPIFIARQVMRHRDAFNEKSGRYSELPSEFYVPKEFRVQDSKNKQKSLPFDFNDHEISGFRYIIIDANNNSYDDYEALLHSVAREQARIVLPLNTYTEFRWVSNLRSMMNFINLRIKPDAQSEVQEYAKVLREIINSVAPLSMIHFEEHILFAETFSKTEVEVLRILAKSVNIDVFKMLMREKGVNERRANKLIAKLGLE